MLVEHTLFGVVDKVAEAIDLLKQHEPPEGYYVCFSGGKDSVTVLDLVKRAGVKYEAWHHIMTIEPPELMKFIYKEYPEVQHNHPNTTMHKLIAKYGYPPLRKARFCCRFLKTSHGVGRFKVTGVRAEESAKRRLRQKLEKDWESESYILNLIFDWTEAEVWEYIHKFNVKYCSLYDEGKKRIGCVFCPYMRPAEKAENLLRYPQFVRYFITACERGIKNKHARGKPTLYQTGAEMFYNWLAYSGGTKKKEPPMDNLFDLKGEN